MKSADRISIDYGFVTQHYQTTWSDHTACGVAGGCHLCHDTPSIMSLTMMADRKPVYSTNQPNSTETATDTNEAAVLYRWTLGKMA